MAWHGMITPIETSVRHNLLFVIEHAIYNKNVRE